tara:strand:+ start:34 stop:1695 length:1662 start_codon:yes stop_codon:yes gene_type:complete
MDAFVSKSPIQKYKEIIEIRTDVSFLELYGMEYLIENFDEETKQKIMDSPYWNLKYIITIDRKWLQRKLEEWKFDYTMKYLYDFFRGVDKVDDYILINISKIIEVLEKEKSLLKENQNKSTIDDFISKMKEHFERGKKYIMVNGQHRNNRWDALFNGEIPLPNNFMKIEDYKIGGRKWWDLEDDVKLILASATHGITFVEDFKNMSDLTHIVNEHNSGNEWNEHQRRIRTSSYIADEFKELDENEDIIKLFKTLKHENKYQLRLEGISFLATQLYYIWRNRSNELYNLPSMKNDSLESLVQLDGNWVKSDVDNFIRFFKSAVYDLNMFFDNLPKRSRLPLRQKISLLRNYFLFKMVLTTDNTKLNDKIYRVIDNNAFVSWWIQSEVGRLMLYNRLNPSGKKEYKSLEKHNKIKTDKDGNLTIPKDISKDLIGKYGLPKEKDYSLQQHGTSKSAIEFVIGSQWIDFIDSLNNGSLDGVVTLKGLNVSSSIKDEVIASSIVNLKKPTINDIWDIVDTDGKDIGHDKVPKADGGSHFIGNLKKENSSNNRSKQNRH